MPRVEAAGKVDGLLELNVAVVVAMDEQHRPAPMREIGDGRGLERDLLRLFAVALLVARRSRTEPDVEEARPVVHAVQVDAGLEDLRIAREPHRGQIAAIGAAPD